MEGIDCTLDVLTVDYYSRLGFGYELSLLTISVNNWRGSLLCFNYDSVSGVDLDILWLKQGIFALIDKIKSLNP